jgi:hypothetical protein
MRAKFTGIVLLAFTTMALAPAALAQQYPQTIPRDASCTPYGCKWTRWLWPTGKSGAGVMEGVWRSECDRSASIAGAYAHDLVVQHTWWGISAFCRGQFQSRRG